MPNLLTTFPVELRLHISRYVTAQEIQLASSSCKLLYQIFANQVIWKNAYRSLLKEYPDNSFVVTQLLNEIKRPDFLTYDQPLTIRWLKDWRTSCKQRTIFIQYILKIQSEVVTAVLQRTILFEDPENTPIFDAKFVTDMESHPGAKFPIDFVVFLQHFAHQVIFSSIGNSWFQMPTLASGTTFESRQAWQDAIHEAHFTSYTSYNKKNRYLIPHSPQATIEIFHQITMPEMIVADANVHQATATLSQVNKTVVRSVLKFVISPHQAVLAIIVPYFNPFDMLRNRLTCTSRYRRMLLTKK